MCTLKKENQYGSGKSDKILTQFKGILTVMQESLFYL